MNIPFRWIVVGIFVLSSALNYLDRQLLAAAAPVIKTEFRLNNQDYGYILTVFSIFYAMASPVMGWVLDRFSLSRGMSFAVGLWSIASIGTAFVTGLPSLLAARAVLAVGEAAGIPSTGKVGALYLPASERAIGAGLSQIGLSIGSVAAPLMATYFIAHYNWRWAFVAGGLLGFVWIPLWLWIERRAPVSEDSKKAPPVDVKTVLREPQMWGFIAGNIVSMTVYSLWTNWTTLFLTTTYGTPLPEANRLASMPHVFAYFGALFGGAISYRLIKRGMEPLAARRRALLLCAVMILSTALAPLMPTALTGALMVSFSFFWASGWGVSYYTMPVDAFGARAAFAVSLLTMAYGILQIFVSPLIGRTIDQYGFGPVCTVAAFTPLIGYAIVTLTTRKA